MINLGLSYFDQKISEAEDLYSGVLGRADW